LIPASNKNVLLQLKKDKIKFDDSKAGVTKMRNYFRQHMALIVVALLPNPRFDGQTKEKLTLHTKDWGFNPSTVSLPAPHIFGYSFDV
jgi:DNA gyrase/topoisomerase IV subunit B